MNLDRYDRTRSEILDEQHCSTTPEEYEEQISQMGKQIMRANELIIRAYMGTNDEPLSDDLGCYMDDYGLEQK